MTTEAHPAITSPENFPLQTGYEIKVVKYKVESQPKANYIYGGSTVEEILEEVRGWVTDMIDSDQKRGQNYVYKVGLPINY